MLQRALAQENRSKDAKLKPDRLSMHMLQGESSDDEGNEVYAAEFVWPSNDKPSTCAWHFRRLAIKLKFNMWMMCLFLFDS